MGLGLFWTKNKDVDFQKFKKPAAMVGITILAALVLPAIVKFTSLFIFTLVSAMLLLVGLACTKPMTFLTGVKNGVKQMAG